MMAVGKPATEDPVAAYKTLLRDIIDRRPSGTRQKIAQALGKHKSFVSQITNPTYAMPVPAKHLTTIFELCHFSPEERQTFLDAFRQAHPGRHLRPVEAPSQATITLSIEVPALKDSRRRAELIDNIRLYADQAIALAQAWDQRTDAPTKGGAKDEKADK